MATHRSAVSPPLPSTPEPRRPRRRLLLAAALVAPLLAGCGAGFQAQTNQIYQPGPGVTDRAAEVYVLNALIVTDGAGNGTLVAGLVNQRRGPDSLQSAKVTSSTGQQLKTTIVGSTLALPPQTLVQLADTGDVRVAGTLTPGSVGSLTLTFRNSAPVKVEVPILSSAPPYDSVPVGPAPSATRPTR